MSGGLHVAVHQAADLQASVSESVKQALHKQKVAHQAAAQATAAGSAQHTETRAGQQAGSAAELKERVFTDLAEGFCSSATPAVCQHEAAQPPASLPAAGMWPAHQGHAAAVPPDTLSTAKAAAADSGKLCTQQSADIGTHTETTYTTLEQQQQAPEAQMVQVTSVASIADRLLLSSELIEVADARQAPLQTCGLQSPTAEGSAGKFSQPPIGYKGPVGLDTHAPDAQLVVEPAVSQEVVGMSQQQARMRSSIAHAPPAARPQLWQVTLRPCCASILLFCVCVCVAVSLYPCAVPCYVLLLCEADAWACTCLWGNVKPSFMYTFARQDWGFATQIQPE